MLTSANNKVQLRLMGTPSDLQTFVQKRPEEVRGDMIVWTIYPSSSFWHISLKTINIELKLSCIICLLQDTDLLCTSDFFWSCEVALVFNNQTETHSISVYVNEKLFQDRMSNIKPITVYKRNQIFIHIILNQLTSSNPGSFCVFMQRTRLTCDDVNDNKKSFTSMD